MINPTAQERAAETVKQICGQLLGRLSMTPDKRVREVMLPVIAAALDAHADAKLSKAIAGIKSVEIPEGSGFIQGLRRNCVEVVERLKSGREKL